MVGLPHCSHVPTVTGGIRTVTPLEASERFGLPLTLVKRAFVWGLANCSPAIGKADEWSVWRAPKRDVEAVFSARRIYRTTEATAPEHMSRTAARMARLRRQIEAGA